MRHVGADAAPRTSPLPRPARAGCRLVASKWPPPRQWPFSSARDESVATVEHPFAVSTHIDRGPGATQRGSRLAARITKNRLDANFGFPPFEALLPAVSTRRTQMRSYGKNGRSCSPD